MHLVYMDDSGTDDENPIAVYGGLVIPDDGFQMVEAIHNAHVNALIPEERLGAFEEFHAFDLYNGRGAFEGIDKEKRLHAISTMLSAVASAKWLFIYAAVEKSRLQEIPILASANPGAIAFQQCVCGVEHWVRSLEQGDTGSGFNLSFRNTCLFIVDDTKDAALKKQLRVTYRSLRRKRPYQDLLRGKLTSRLLHAHDDLYFGDSRDSVGIQMAYLCSYFTCRRLKGIPDSDGFYALFESCVRCAKAEPEWTNYRQIFRCYDEPLGASV